MKRNSISPEAYTNPTFIQDRSDINGRLPTDSRTPYSQIGGNPPGKNNLHSRHRYEYQLEIEAGPSQLRGCDSSRPTFSSSSDALGRQHPFNGSKPDHQQRTGYLHEEASRTAYDDIEPDYDDEIEIASNQRQPSSSADSVSIPHQASTAKPSTEKFGNSSRVTEPDRPPIWRNANNARSDYAVDQLNNPGNVNIEEMKPRKQTSPDNTSTCKSGSYPRDSARNKGMAWMDRAGEDSRSLEHGQASGENQRSEKKIHMTMKNAKEIAREIGMMLDEDDLRKNENDDRSLQSLGASDGANDFGHLKRKCWGRRCWSKSFHSHIQRFTNMDGKNNFQTRLQQTPVSPATGLLAWELKQQKARKRVTDYWKEVKSQLHLWSKSMKTIEGRYGTGVVSYFIFLRWLLYLNLLIFLSVLVLIVFPQAFSPPTALNPLSPTTSPNLTISPTTTLTNAVSLPHIQRGDTQDLTTVLGVWHTDDLEQCWERYKEMVKNKTDTKVLSRLQDFVQGTGWMETTLLFPGWYNFKIDNLYYQKEEYKLSLAYILVTLAYFLVCLVMMVIYTTQGVRETMMTSEGHLNRYCNLVFCGWDYCIEGRANAQRKHHSIIQEVKSNLAEERRRAEVAKWSHMKKAIIYSRRLLINIVVLVGLGAAGYLIYDVCKTSLEATQDKATDKTDMSKLLNEFLPSLTITGLNIVLPTLFTQICILEKYSVAFEIKITLIRTVFLRLASVGVLVVTMYYQVTGEQDRECNSRAQLPCWETYVGQQMYKLVILDFIVTVVMILLIELPRMLIVKHCKCKLAEIIGRQEFDIPKHVLDLVYSQTLCWLGTFYSPLLPAVCVLKYIFFFYLKKFTLLVNCVPSKIPYRASRSNTFFMIVLMLSFLLASIPLWYSVANVPPSRGCGPFRPYNTMWDPITDTIQSWPNVLREIFKFLVSVGFAAPVLIMLCLATYYYSTVSAANKKMIRVLRDQLVIEGTDKQFLLARLAEVAKRRHNSEDQQ